MTFTPHNALRLVTWSGLDLIVEIARNAFHLIVLNRTREDQRALYSAHCPNRAPVHAPTISRTAFTIRLPLCSQANRCLTASDAPTGTVVRIARLNARAMAAGS